ncbi:MAG: hypothetical protein IPJ54_18100 [Saprospiraceae bacterium]|nr:hypothetical protein [Saprospiraceae bacterium]
MRNLTLIFCFLSAFFVAFVSPLSGQMKVGNQVFYGNEWINHAQTYHKLKVGHDGLHKINHALLSQLGLLQGGSAERIAIFKNGKQIPLYLTSPNQLGDQDFILFYGEKNTIELDTFLFANWKQELLNPFDSYFSDSSAYYLTYLPTGQTGLRYEVLSPNYINHGLPSELYYLHTDEYCYRDRYYKPNTFHSNDLQFSNMVSSEGFSKDFSSFTSVDFNVYDVYVSPGVPAKLGMHISTNQNFSNQNRKSISLNNNLLGINTEKRNVVARPVFDIAGSDLKNTNNVTITSPDLEYFGLAGLSITYPRSFNFKQVPFALYSGSGKKYVELSEFDYAYEVVLDPSAGKAYKLNKLGDNKAELITSDQDFSVVLDKEATTLTTAQTFTFRDISQLNPEFLIITSTKLYNTKGGQVDEINNYKRYKESAEGGSYKTEVVFVDEIYNQFGYGIENHVMAFKNFSHYVEKNWPSLEYVLLLGKGLEYFNTRNEDQINSQLYSHHFVPSFGSPPSDVLLFSDGISFDAKYSIGRLAATNMEEIGFYLEKLKTHDAAIKSNDTDWLKKILHLGGGGELGEQIQIKSNLNVMKKLIEGDMYGGTVNSYYKDNSSSTSIANLPKITETINNGVSILCFFGHSSVGLFDYTLDDPKNYNNAGKLPFLLSLGCYSGNICSSSTGISEKFVLSPNKGSIGFVAASGSAYINTQGSMGINFYTELTGAFYNKPVGKIYRKLALDAENILKGDYTSQNNEGFSTMYQQLMLHGDPSLIIHGFEKPDFSIAANSVTTLPNPVVVQKDSLELLFDVKNSGKSVEDSINVVVLHKGPNDKVISSRVLRIATPKYNSNFHLKLNVQGVDIVGLNKIKITVDEAGEVDELKEDNNEFEYNFLVLSSKIKANHPHEFAIVDQSKPFTLVANSINSIAELKDYIIQIDTTESFNSPLMVERIFTDAPGSIEWQPDFIPVHNTTYYWRVAENKDLGNGLDWSSSSFTYLIDGGEGWTQRHYYQFLKNEYFQMSAQPANHFQFGGINYLVNVKSQRYIDDLNIPYTTINGAKWGSLTPNQGNANLMNVTVWTSRGLWRNNSTTDYGSLPYSKNIFAYDISTKQGRKGIKELLDAVPDSAYVMLFVSFTKVPSDFNYQEWETDLNTLGYSLYNTLADWGATQFIEYKTSGPKPYIFVMQKNVGKIHEEIGETTFDQLNYSTVVPASAYEGKMWQTIGPVIAWDEFDWNIYETTPLIAPIKAAVNIYTIDNNGVETLHLSDVTTKTDLSDINALTHPYIRIEYSSLDWDDFEPADVLHWTVKYTGLPDLVLEVDNDPSIPDTIDQGEPLKLSSLIKLKGLNQLDSCKTSFKLVSSNNTSIGEDVVVQNLSASQAKAVDYTFETSKINGLHQIVVSVNEEQRPQEKYYTNNSGIKTIFIKPDKINPAMDVTFDGVKIINGDLVSPTPDIVIRINDENKYLHLESTSLARIELITMATGNTEVLSPDDSRLSFAFEHKTGKNEARITFSPTLEDGDYTLLVQTQDESGNVSGNNMYTVEFRVSAEKKFSNFYNYPNPFSTSTQFIFEFSGGLPENMKLQIMTLSGKVVKEVTMDELGPLRVGINRTLYRWDGTDDFGNKLGNGVYLMKAIGDSEFFDPMKGERLVIFR